MNGSHPISFRLTGVDYAPDELHDQLPVDGFLLRRLAGPDRPDYWLAELSAPLHWRDGSVSRTVTHLVVATRYEGESIHEGLERVVVGIAYVTDSSLLKDEMLGFDKAKYVAIGVLEHIDEIADG